MVPILKVDPNKVRPMKVVDMWTMKGVGGFLNYKYIRTYFKLASNDNKGNVRFIDVTFDVPVQDIQSKRITKGSIILVEEYPKGLKYLGVDGDWETMLSFGIAPEKEVKFGTFSTNEFSELVERSLSYDEYEVNGKKRVEIRQNGQLVAELEFLNGTLVKRYCGNKIGSKLANQWLESRGYEVSSLTKEE